VTYVKLRALWAGPESLLVSLTRDAHTHPEGLASQRLRALRPSWPHLFAPAQSRVLLTVPRHSM